MEGTCDTLWTQTVLPTEANRTVIIINCIFFHWMDFYTYQLPTKGKLILIQQKKYHAIEQGKILLFK